MIIGVDPGVTGAIAVLKDAGELYGISDMPTYKPGKANKVNAAALHDLIEESMTGYCTAFIELVGPMPRDGSVQAFNFGHAVGVLEGVMASLCIPMEFVTPQVWKRHFSLIKKDKEASRAKAIHLYPQASLARKKDAGRAEALLIARYGFDRLASKAAA